MPTAKKEILRARYFFVSGNFIYKIAPETTNIPVENISNEKIPSDIQRKIAIVKKNEIIIKGATSQ